MSENRLNPIVPNGFADHYPYNKWLAIIGKINLTFSVTNPLLLDRAVPDPLGVAVETLALEPLKPGHLAMAQKVPAMSRTASVFRKALSQISQMSQKATKIWKKSNYHRNWLNRIGSNFKYSKKKITWNQLEIFEAETHRLPAQCEQERYQSTLRWGGTCVAYGNSPSSKSCLFMKCHIRISCNNCNVRSYTSRHIKTYQDISRHVKTTRLSSHFNLIRISSHFLGPLAPLAPRCAEERTAWGVALCRGQAFRPVALPGRSSSVHRWRSPTQYPSSPERLSRRNDESNDQWGLLSDSVRLQTPLTNLIKSHQISYLPTWNFRLHPTSSDFRPISRTFQNHWDKKQHSKNPSIIFASFQHTELF